MPVLLAQKATIFCMQWSFIAVCSKIALTFIATVNTVINN